MFRVEGWFGVGSNRIDKGGFSLLGEFRMGLGFTGFKVRSR